MAVVYLLLGGNVGDVLHTLAEARLLLTEQVGPLFQASAIYQTQAWGTPEPQPDYLNQVLALETRLSPPQVLRICLDIEQELGRIRSHKNAPRTLDIDILLWDRLIHLAPDLEIPHPRMADRRFVLEPLCEIAPDKVHPTLGLTLWELLQACPDTGKVNRLGRT